VRAKGLREHLSEHYAGKTLPAATVARLTSLVSVPATASPVQRIRFPARPRRLAYGLAACVAALALGNAYFVVENRGLRSRVAELSHDLVSARGELTAQMNGHNFEPEPTSGVPDSPAKGGANLVAMRVCANWCQNCAVIQPMFQRLEQKYDGRSIRFVDLNISNDATRRQCSQTLGLDCGEWMIQQCDAAGTILLFDCEGHRLLASLSDADQLPRLEQVLDAALDKKNP